MTILILIFVLLLAPANGQVPRIPVFPGLQQTPAPAPAATPPSVPAKSPELEDPLGRATPRGTVVGFLKAAHGGDFAKAAQYLETNARGDDVIELVTQLGLVLDQGLPTTLDQLSDQAEGDLNDKLPANQELVGVITTTGGPLRITLVRMRRAGQMVWLFSSDTLREVPAVYEEFNSTWLSSHAPSWLMRRGWLGIPLWQWFAVVLTLIVAFLVAGLIRRLATQLMRRMARSLSEQHQDLLVERLVGPIRAFLVLAVVDYCLSLLQLPFFARQIEHWLRGILIAFITGWLFVRVVQISGKIVGQRMEKRRGADVTGLIRLVQRTLNGLAIFLVVVIWMKSAGLSVSAVLTGLGLGGVAIAFAAQKTLENLFGGVSIIFDKPVRVGDYCRVNDRNGFVEDIGLRSTSIRTDDRTVLSVPNGLLSTLIIENFSVRDKFWFRHVIGLRTDTSADQMNTLLDALRNLLGTHPLVEPNTWRVRLIKVTPNSMDLEFWLYILTTDALKFLEVQESLLIEIMQTIERDSGLAMQTQTVYLNRAQSNPRPPDLSRGTEGSPAALPQQ